MTNNILKRGCLHAEPCYFEIGYDWGWSVQAEYSRGLIDTDQWRRSFNRRWTRPVLPGRWSAALRVHLSREP